MSAKASVMQLGRHCVVTVKAAINHLNAAEIEAAVQGWAGPSPATVILDCRDVGYLDSAALVMLLRLQEGLKERGGALKLVALNALCRDIIVATRIVNEIEIAATTQEAIKEPL